MGLLTVGKPHSWDHAGKYREYVRRHGVVQFLNTYNRVKDITNDELLWGDEVCDLLQSCCCRRSGRMVHRDTWSCKLALVAHKHGGVGHDGLVKDESMMD